MRGERVGEEGFLRERYGLEPPLAEILRVQVEPLRRPLAEISLPRAANPSPSPTARAGITLREIAEHLWLSLLDRQPSFGGKNEHCCNARPTPPATPPL